MKTRQWISRIAALSTLAVVGVTFAEVGIRDGEDHFRNFKSTKSRAEVRAEFDAARNQAAAQSSDRASGARGVAGARYSGKTREEVRDELIQNRRTIDPYSPDYIYFGG